MTDDAGIGPDLIAMREENLAHRIEYEMQGRGWSQERLATEMAAVGHPIHQSAISKIINPKGGKRRTISVDEAVGFARVFETDLESLLLPVAIARNDEAKRILARINQIGQEQTALDAERQALAIRLAALIGAQEARDLLRGER